MCYLEQSGEIRQERRSCVERRKRDFRPSTSETALCHHSVKKQSVINLNSYPCSLVPSLSAFFSPSNTRGWDWGSTSNDYAQVAKYRSVGLVWWVKLSACGKGAQCRWDNCHISQSDCATQISRGTKMLYYIHQTPLSSWSNIEGGSEYETRSTWSGTESLLTVWAHLNFCSIK